MTLAAESIGSADAPSVLLIPGMGQTRHSWAATARMLADHGYRATAIDLRGHGESEWSPEARYDYPALAGDVADVLATIGASAVIGASLGGLSALLCAGGTGSAAMRALVLVDVVPAVEPSGADAVFDFMSAKPEGFASIEEAVTIVSMARPGRRRPPTAAGLSRNLRRGEDGRYRWHWDPRFLTVRRQEVPNVRGRRFDAAIVALTIPTLLLRGGRSNVVSAEGAADFLARVPHAECIEIPDADHMMAGDGNGAFSAPLLSFLDRSLNPTSVSSCPVLGR